MRGPGVVPRHEHHPDAGLPQPTHDVRSGRARRVADPHEPGQGPLLPVRPIGDGEDPKP